MSASITDKPAAIRRNRLKGHDRAATVLALQVAGLKQREIASELGLDIRTVQRDIEKSSKAKAAISTSLDSLNAELESILTVKDRAGRYAELAIRAKNEAVSLGALQRIDDLGGIVTEKERLRAKTQAESAVQPMFVLPAGTEVRLSVGPAQPQDVVDERIEKARNVTPRQ